MPERLTITAFSTALYSTWIFIEDLRLLLDAGDGVSAHLMGKVRKVHKVAVTHADRDHLTGLFQLQQLTAHVQPLEVFFPADSGSFPAIASFCERFDPWSGPKVKWTPVRSGPCAMLTEQLCLKAVDNSHVPSGDLVKSLGYKVVRESRKLRPKHAGKKALELAAIRSESGEDALTYPVEEVILAYSGDTGVCEPDTWRGSGILIHEATFLAKEDMERGRERAQQHSVLPDVLAMAREAEPQILVLNHFSSRYSEEEIRPAVATHAADLSLKMPIYVIPPGRVISSVLEEAPAWIARI